MDGRQTKIVLGAAFMVILVWCVATFFFAYREPERPLSQTPLQFDADRAFRFMQEFVTHHPRRVLGSIEARQSTGYLRQELERVGYKISYTHFDAILAGRRQVGRNVLALKQGRTQEILAVVAHYDTARTTFQGAEDNGSGVGVLLELARVFADSTPRRNFLFILSDGEEWGMLGAQDIAKNHPDRNRIVAVLSLDNVAVGEIDALGLDTIGQRGGYTPAWLRGVARKAALLSGLPVVEPSGLREHLERSLLLSQTDQGPFLNASIAAINLGSASQDRSLQLSVYHSWNDVVENMMVPSFEVYGRVSESILRTLDETPSIPRPATEGFRLRADQYLSHAWVVPLHYATFLPFLAILYFHLMNHPKYLNPGRVQREGIEYLTVFLPLALAYGSTLGFRGLGIITRFSIYPPPPKDPILESPGWKVTGGILVVLLLTACVFYFLKRILLRKFPEPDFYISKSVLMTILLVVALVALQYNSYWTVSFLLLPAWVWGMVGISRSAISRGVNRIWLLAAGAVYYLIIIFYAVQLGLGWKIFWYEILALGNGMFRPEGTLLAIATISLGVRFLAIQSHGREE